MMQWLSKKTKRTSEQKTSENSESREKISNDEENVEVSSTNFLANRELKQERTRMKSDLIRQKKLKRKNVGTD